jgi:hypothetical protein
MAKKKRLNFLKKIKHVDDIMTQSCLISCQNSTLFVRYKITNFKSENCPDDLLEIRYFYISRTKSSFGQDILQSCVSSYHLHVCFLI